MSDATREPGLTAAIVASSVEAIVAIDDDGRVALWNPAAEALFGIVAGEAIGRAIADVTGASHDEWKRVLESVRVAGALKQHEMRSTRAGRTPTRLVWSLAPLSGARGGACGIVRDATELQKLVAQAGLADNHNALAQMAAAVAERLDGPLAFTLGNLGFAADELASQRERAEPVDADVVQAVDDALVGAGELARTAHDLAMIARGDSSSWPVDVGAVLDSAVRIVVAEMASTPHIVRDIEPAVLARAHPVRLGQAFVRVLRGADRAVVDSSRPRRMRVAVKTDRDEVLVTIAHEALNDAPISVVDALGFWICRAVVEAMEGTLLVDSDGDRVVFSFRLRRGERAPLPSVRDPSSTSVDAPRGRVLVIDDEPLIGRGFARVLKREHDVVVESDVERALQRIRTETFDLVLCDVILADASARDFYERVRADKPDVADAIVFITGGAFLPSAQSFLARVANVRLEKPIEASVLRALVAARVRSRRRS